jgi:hypothetical protein
MIWMEMDVREIIEADELTRSGVMYAGCLYG